MPTFRSVVRISHSVLGGTGTNTWHARTASPDVGGIEQEIDDIAEFLETFYDTLSTVFADPAAITHDGVWQEVMPEDPDDPMTIEGTGFSVSGEATGNFLPPFSCICVGWRTASGGRSGRGRTFLGPLTTSSIDTDGTIDPSVLTGVRSAADALVESSDSFANGALGVFSRDADSVPPAPVFRDFVSAQVRDKFASLRSRRD